MTNDDSDGVQPVVRVQHAADRLLKRGEGPDPPLLLIKTISQPRSWENRVKFETPSPPVGMVSQLLPGFEFGSLP